MASTVLIFKFELKRSYLPIKRRCIEADGGLGQVIEQFELVIQVPTDVISNVLLKNDHEEWLKECPTSA